MIDLKNKTILITGASSGIGKETALLFNKLGANLILTGRNKKSLDEIYESLDKTFDAKIILADLTNTDDVKNLVSSIDSNIDGFVHCCGMVMPVPIKYIKESQLSEVFKVNYFSAVNCISELLVKSKLKNNGSIVFLSSISTLHAYFGGAPYISSKAALEGYAKTLALELIPKKIRVNVLQPALIKTAIFNKTIDAAIDENNINELISKYPLGIGEPIDVANAIAFFISDSSKWITGSNLKMDGGLTLGFK